MSFRRIAGPVLALCAAFTVVASAQSKSATFGVLAGATFAKFVGSDVASEDDLSFTKTHVGYAAGGFVTLGISPNFAIQPEAMYVVKGGKAEENGFSVRFKLSYLELPVLAKVRIPAKGNGRQVSPHFYVGPAIGFKVGCSLKLSDGTTTTAESCGDNDIELKSTDLSLVFGAGVDIGRAMLDIRYDMGLSNLDDSGQNNDAKNRTFFILVGWSFRAPR